MVGGENFRQLGLLLGETKGLRNIAALCKWSICEKTWSHSLEQAVAQSEYFVSSNVIFNKSSKSHYNNSKIVQNHKMIITIHFRPLFQCIYNWWSFHVWSTSNVRSTTFIVVLVELQPRKPATNVDGLGTLVEESRFVCVSASLKITPNQGMRNRARARNLTRDLRARKLHHYDDKICLVERVASGNCV